MQDAYHVLCRLLLHDLLSFMSQSRTVGNIVYFITTYIIENNVPKTHKITKNAYFSTKRKLVLPLMQKEAGHLQESANPSFNDDNALQQI